MSHTSTVQELNRNLAQTINEETRQNPHSPYANKFVGIANGQIVAIADDPEELSRLLRQSEPDPKKCFCVEASRDYSQVEVIWEGTDASLAMDSSIGSAMRTGSAISDALATTFREDFARGYRSGDSRV